MKQIKTAQYEAHFNDLRKRFDDADVALQGDAASAIDGFVGHMPNSRDSDFPMGLMMPDRLESAYSGQTPTRTQLETAFQPIREHLRQQFGPTLTLYRCQRPVPSDAKPRNVLSWTMDRKYAEHLAGIRPVKPLTEQRIQEILNTFTTTGTAKVGRKVFRLSPDDPTGVDMFSAADEYGDEDHIITLGDGRQTPAEALQDELQQIKADREEIMATNQQRQHMVLQRTVPLEEIVWATDRAGQMEFILRNNT